MDYMSANEIQKYKIATENLNEPTPALGSYYHWLCPRCKKALHAEKGRFVNKCLDCDQVIKW